MVANQNDGRATTNPRERRPFPQHHRKRLDRLADQQQLGLALLHERVDGLIRLVLKFFVSEA